MRHKTLDVQPFEATYRVFNKVTRDYHGEFNRLIEAVNYAKGSFKPANYNQARLSFTLKREEDFRYYNTLGYTASFRPIRELHSVPATPWVIVSEYGVVSAYEVKAAVRAEPHTYSSYDRALRYELKGIRLTRRKGSGDKIKVGCAQIPSNSHWGGYDNPIRGYFRAIRTTNEQRQNTGHIDEYGEGLVRGRRRCLPSCYDDHYNGMWDTEDSWKHHSKRTKQWKPK